MNTIQIFGRSVQDLWATNHCYFLHFLLFRCFKNIFTPHLRSLYMNQQRWQILSSRIDSVDLSRTTSAPRPAKYLGPFLIYRSLQIRTRRFHIKSSRAHGERNFFDGLCSFINRALIKYNRTETANLHSNPIVCAAII